LPSCISQIDQRQTRPARPLLPGRLTSRSAIYCSPHYRQARRYRRVDRSWRLLSQFGLVTVTFKRCDRYIIIYERYLILLDSCPPQIWCLLRKGPRHRGDHWPQLCKFLQNAPRSSLAPTQAPKTGVANPTPRPHSLQTSKPAPRSWYEKGLQRGWQRRHRWWMGQVKLGAGGAEETGVDWFRLLECDAGVLPRISRKLTVRRLDFAVKWIEILNAIYIL